MCTNKDNTIEFIKQRIEIVRADITSGIYTKNRVKYLEGCLAAYISMLIFIENERNAQG